MTLIGALRCQDGTILASDSRQSRGAPGNRVARSMQKVMKPRPGFVLAAAGPQDVTQELALRIQRSDITTNVDRLAIKRQLIALLNEITKTDGLEGASDHIEFILAWWSKPDKKPVALHVYSGGRAEFVEGWAFGGVLKGVDGANFVANSLNYVSDPSELTVESAKALLLKVMRDTIESTVDEIGGAVQMGVVEKGHADLVNEAGLRIVTDALGLWESQSAELLVGGKTPAEGDTPDRGVRPPQPG